MVKDSKFAIIILERTPVIGPMAVDTTLALEDIAEIVDNMKNEKDRESVNFQVLHKIVHYSIISKEDAQKLIDDDKIHFENTVII